MIYYLTQLLPFVLIGALTIGSIIRFIDFDAEHFDGMFDSLSADYMSQVGPVNEGDMIIKTNENCREE